MKMKEKKSVKRGQRIKGDSRKLERKEVEDGRRAKYQGACQCRGLMVGYQGCKQFLFVIK